MVENPPEKGSLDGSGSDGTEVTVGTTFMVSIMELGTG
jgi:hypothetical protein